VLRAQEWLADTLGEKPTAVAYPNGDHDEAVLRVCEEAGLRLGFTVRPAKTSLPLESTSPRMMRLGRFTPHADSAISSQCRTYRSDLQIYGSFRSGYLKLRGRATR
jgi:peptidoglycan/xylan/chitin deacetylase (PgdA/CDA1 family)